ncbi:bifunctional riboflavin kinase/FAD synthetase [Pseudolysinimonas sp.]|uniref:bifunctional riboflavin kinase/FAD synthetase n=1 Tax=Pseudolysinimonas sp. TaxID=2680009 RepID=UPI00286C8D7E|nr:bifunctional riboflavin kinase/FAD synthetase [Pseudolysinimonas sp.]
MLLIENLDDVPAGFGPSAVTVGKFDGVHLGHRGVLAQLTSLAADRGLQPVVVTFDRHPFALLRPDECPESLVSNDQRAALLAETDVSATLMLEFTREVSDLEPVEFSERILHDALDTRLVLLGADFRFGHRGAGRIDSMREHGKLYGFEVVLLEDVLVGGDRVSSTKIREHLAAGEVREAAALLGRYPRVRSTVVHGDAIGREIGFPTANLDPAMEGFLPGDGVYAAWAWVDGARYGAAVSIGNNPTFDSIPARRTEAHLIDTSVDAYGKSIELDFVEYIRPMVKFDGVPTLVAALTADVERIRALLADEASLAVENPG